MDSAATSAPPLDITSQVVAEALETVQATLSARSTHGGQYLLAGMEHRMQTLRATVMDDEKFSLEERERLGHEYVAIKGFVKSVEEAFNRALLTLHAAKQLPPELAHLLPTLPQVPAPISREGTDPFTGLPSAT